MTIYRTLILLAICLSFPVSAFALDQSGDVKATTILKTTDSWDGKPIVYPNGTAVESGARRGDRLCTDQWDGLVRFLDDGRIEIDSNTVERSMRPIALNRKNALFAGHDLGAENWAVLASLIETCKLHGVNPEVWLADVLTRLVDNWPNSRLAELTRGPGKPPKTASIAPRCECQARRGGEIRPRENKQLKTRGPRAPLTFSQRPGQLRLGWVSQNIAAYQTGSIMNMS